MSSLLPSAPQPPQTASSAIPVAYCQPSHCRTICHHSTATIMASPIMSEPTSTCSHRHDTATTTATTSNTSYSLIRLPPSVVHSSPPTLRWFSRNSAASDAPLVAAASDLHVTTLLASLTPTRSAPDAQRIEVEISAQSSAAGLPPRPPATPALQPPETGMIHWSPHPLRRRRCHCTCHGDSGGAELGAAVASLEAEMRWKLRSHHRRERLCHNRVQKAVLRPSTDACRLASQLSFAELSPTPRPTTPPPPPHARKPPDACVSPTRFALAYPPDTAATDP